MVERSEPAPGAPADSTAGPDTALRHSDERFRLLVEQSAESFFLADGEGHFLEVNRAACEELGYTRAELLALSPWDVVTEFTPHSYRELFREMLAHGPQRLTRTHRRKDGTTHPVEGSACLVELDGRPVLLALTRDITERLRAEAALQESEDKFHKIFNHSNDAGFLFDPAQGAILDVNHRACTLLGYAREELLALPVSAVHPDEMPRMVTFTQAVLEEGTGWTDELTCLTKNGEKLPTEFSASAVVIGGQPRVVAWVRDISTRRMAEAALRESEERLARILESAMDAIVAIDAEQRIRLFNAAAEKVFRCSAAQALGTSLERFLPPRFHELLAGHGAGPEGGGLRPPLWVAEGLTARRADGEEFPVEATISEVEAAGETLRTIILRDVNERHRTEAELRKLRLEKLYLQEEIDAEHGAQEVVGTSPGLGRVLRQTEQVAGTDSIVLITGETGTGKERVARAIHQASNRRSRVLVKVNCAALPAGLIESELFGHEKGAFTGAIARRLGRFELADGGTIFLDEIGDLPLELQAKLLHVLQEGEFERVGSPRTMRVDVRVIAATNRDLEKAVAEERFRADLYYRLKVFPIHVPPLRERREDIPLLVKYFARRYGAKLGKRIETVAPETLAALLRYPWPGNVRELENVIERAIIISRGNELELGDWPAQPGAPPLPSKVPTLDDVQREHIREVLQQTSGRVSGPMGAARILGLKPSTLAARMKRLGIERQR